MKTYAPLDVTFEHGEGAYLWDNNQQKYLDALCGIAVCGLGHAHPAVTKTITEQAAKSAARLNALKALAQTLVPFAGLLGLPSIFTSFPFFILAMIGQRQKHISQTEGISLAPRLPGSDCSFVAA